MARVHQIPGLSDHPFRRDAAVGPAGERNDAERAAVVAALLNLQEGAGPVFKPGEERGRHLAGRHDVRHDHGFGARQMAGTELLRIANDPVDLGHGRERGGVQLRRAAGHDEPRRGPFAPQPANGLPRLTDGLRGDRAGVHDHRVVQPGGGRRRPHRLRFEGVQPAAQGDDVRRGHDQASSDPGSDPLKLTATGPVIKT